MVRMSWMRKELHTPDELASHAHGLRTTTSVMRSMPGTATELHSRHGIDDPPSLHGRDMDDGPRQEQCSSWP